MTLPGFAGRDRADEDESTGCSIKPDVALGTSLSSLVLARGDPSTAISHPHASRSPNLGVRFLGLPPEGAPGAWLTEMAAAFSGNLTVWPLGWDGLLAVSDATTVPPQCTVRRAPCSYLYVVRSRLTFTRRVAWNGKANHACVPGCFFRALWRRVYETNINSGVHRGVEP